MPSSIEEKIEQFKTMSTFQNENVICFGLSIIEEVIILNSQLCKYADRVCKENDELTKVSKELQKEHKRIMKEVLKTKKEGK
jgi:hypothetical protein